jgi:hypothetical protein
MGPPWPSCYAGQGLRPLTTDLPATPGSAMRVAKPLHRRFDVAAVNQHGDGAYLFFFRLHAVELLKEISACPLGQLSVQGRFLGVLLGSTGFLY